MYQHIMEGQAKNLILWGVGIVAGIGVIGFVYTQFFQYTTTYKEVPVVTKNIQTTVMFSGSVVPASRVALAFERTGRVTSIRKDTGESVQVGDVLISLDTVRAQALVEEARAQVALEQSALDALLEGTREEQLAIAREQLYAQQDSVQSAEEELAQTINTAFADVDAALYTFTDQMFVDPQSTTPTLRFSAIDSSRRTAVHGLRRSLGVRIEDVRTNSASVETMQSLLNDVAYYLGELSFLLTNRVPSATPSDATVSAWQTNITSARSGVENSQTTLLGKEIALRAARAKEAVYARELTLLESGSTSTTIEGQEARLRSREATLARYMGELREYSLRSPISGVVNNVSVEVGELVQANVPVVEVLSQGAFDISADVSELDLPFLKIGDRALITFDAYGEALQTEARIVSIDPAERIINGVPAYGVTLRIESTDERIRSGLTANVSINAIERENVPTLPREAITFEGGVARVLLQRNDSIEEIVIETGIQGRDGTVEIISGLEEGDTVVIPS